MKRHVLKIGTQIRTRHGKKYYYPKIEMKGRWVEREGFYTGNEVRVNVVNKFITIEAI